MGVFDTIGSETHQSVHFGSDPESGLRSIVAIHSTILGPSLGGARFYPYRSEEDALIDVLRLAKSMTYKAACAGLAQGGGKAVIIGNPAADKTDALFRAFGRFVEGLDGQYITAEDVGTTVPDMEVVATQTRHVSGLGTEHGGSGDPSPATARGVIAAHKAVAHMLWGSHDLAGRRVAIKGVGKVGMSLAERLSSLGAEIVVADVDPRATDTAATRYGAKVVDVEDIHRIDCDIFAPCALGGDISKDTIPELSCTAIAGSANNQLVSDEDGDLLKSAGILYAPDYVVNAGGIINIAAEQGGYTIEKAANMIDAIYENLTEILTTADRLGIGTHVAAAHVAEERISAVALEEATT
ncbi:MAG: leucine dehydrogenase [Acidimicrobiia bacterium]|nr:MAG: leucine dehydrogenase [Acidimicrobiia bacterium]